MGRAIILPNKRIKTFAIAHWDRLKAAALYASRYVALNDE